MSDNLTTDVLTSKNLVLGCFTIARFHAFWVELFRILGITLVVKILTVHKSKDSLYNYEIISVRQFSTSAFWLMETIQYFVCIPGNCQIVTEISWLRSQY